MWLEGVRPPGSSSTSSDELAALAQHARRTALVRTLRARPNMSLAQLRCLVKTGKYAVELRSLRFEELIHDQGPLGLAPGESPEGGVMGLEPGETPEDAVMRLFRRSEGKWLSSQFFSRWLGLTRWQAQSICRALARAGRIQRHGATSGTRYCFMSPKRGRS